MPLYEFECAECGAFTELRRVSECDMLAACPKCAVSASRLISVPQLAIMGKSDRTARERNEKSAHEPRRVNAAHRHDRDHEEKRKHGRSHNHKHVHNGRPWMLGH